MTLTRIRLVVGVNAGFDHSRGLSKNDSAVHVTLEAVTHESSSVSLFRFLQAAPAQHMRERSARRCR